MREFSTPMSVAVAGTGNLTDDVVRNATEAPDEAVLARRTPGSEEWQDVTAAEFLAQVRGVAKGLMAAGVVAGDRIALISRTRYEWTLLDYATWFAGAVSVPIYETSSTEQVALDPERLRAPWRWSPRGRRTWPGSRRCAATARGPAARLVDRGQRRRRADPAGRGHLRRRAGGAADDGDTARPGHHHLHLGHDRTPQGLHAHPRQLHDRARRRGRGARRAVRPERRLDPALPPPGPRVRADHPGRARSRQRVRLGHSADVKNLVRDLGQFQPTFVLAVPRVFEKIFNTASQNATADGRGRIFDRAAEVAMAWSRGQDRRARSRWPCAPSTPRSPGSSTPGCARRSAAGARTPSPVAPRSASGWATSTAASA